VGQQEGSAAALPALSRRPFRRFAVAFIRSTWWPR